MKNMDKWITDVIESKHRVAIPIMTNPGIELCHRTVKEAVTDGAIHAEAILKLNETYPAAASTVIMDLTVEAEAFGAEITLPENEVPAVIGRLVKDKVSIEALEIPTLDKGRVQEYLKANRLTAEGITDKPVLAGCIGPFSLAGRLYDLSEMMMALYIEPDTMLTLLDKCTTFLIDYCKAIKETKVNGVVIAEPAAGLVSNEDCSKFSSVFVKKIVDAVQDENFLVVLHNCGNNGHCTEAMLETGAKALHFGNKIDMLKALSDCPDNILAMGNLDPVSVFKQETAENTYKITLDLLEKTKDYKNFVLSSGCDVPPAVSFDNIEAFYNALNDFNRL